jgi:Predicted transcriptional regulator
MPPKILKKKESLRPTFIREWRAYRNLSQDRLVARVRENLIGFSKSTLSRLENSKQAYTQPMLEALADALNCEPADLLARDPTSEFWTLYDALRKMRPEQQRQIAKIVETFKQAA